MSKQLTLAMQMAKATWGEQLAKLKALPQEQLENVLKTNRQCEVEISKGIQQMESKEIEQMKKARFFREDVPENAAQFKQFQDDLKYYKKTFHKVFPASKMKTTWQDITLKDKSEITPLEQKWSDHYKALWAQRCAQAKTDDKINEYNNTPKFLRPEFKSNKPFFDDEEYLPKPKKSNLYEIKRDAGHFGIQTKK